MKLRIRRAVCLQTGPRRGAIAVVVMIAILITFSIGLGMVRTALQSREQALRWQKQTQARWLVEAGIERAAARLRNSADYRGETWKLSAEELGGRRNGEVRIELEASGEDDHLHRLTVVADYPAKTEKRIRSRKVIAIAGPALTENDEP